MSQLSHPNTARVFLYGQLDDGACYFVMEHLVGQNLAQLVRAEGAMEEDAGALHGGPGGASQSGLSDAGHGGLSSTQIEGCRGS